MKLTWLCIDFLISGEFGVVYKASLQWNLDAATEMVAVKTLKGIYIFLSLKVLLVDICTRNFSASDITSGNVFGRYLCMSRKGGTGRGGLVLPKQGRQKLVLDGQAMVEVAVSQDFSAYTHKSQKKKMYPFLRHKSSQRFKPLWAKGPAEHLILPKGPFRERETNLLMRFSWKV